MRPKVTATHETARLGDRRAQRDHRAMPRPTMKIPTRLAASHGLAEAKTDPQAFVIGGKPKTSPPPTISAAASMAARMAVWIPSRTRAPDATVVTDAATRSAKKEWIDRKQVVRTLVDAQPQEEEEHGGPGEHRPVRPTIRREPAPYGDQDEPEGPGEKLDEPIPERQGRVIFEVIEVPGERIPSTHGLAAVGRSLRADAGA